MKTPLLTVSCVGLRWAKFRKVVILLTYLTRAQDYLQLRALPLTTELDRMKQQEQSMVDWTELEKAAKLFERHIFELSRGNPRFVVRSSGIIETFADSDAETLNKVLAQFPAILSERQAMLAKLEAAQRLRDAVACHKKEVGDIPVKSIDDPLYAALVAFDKETE